MAAANAWEKQKLPVYKTRSVLKEGKPSFVNQADSGTGKNTSGMDRLKPSKAWHWK